MFLAPILLNLLQERAPAPLLPVRPRDPFVFRCVLDGRARMITAALDADMWVAWDASNCGLHKAWKGGVNFDGPVYTTVHGPQPTTRGSAYTSGPDSAVWTAFEGQEPLEARADFGGYSIQAGSLALEWRIRFASGREVVVIERPEFVHPRQLMNASQLDEAVLGDGSQPGLQRSFEAAGIPDGVRLDLKLRTDGAVGKIAGRLEHERFEDLKDEHGHVTATRVWSHMPLTQAAPRNVVILFFAPIAAEPERKPEVK